MTLAEYVWGNGQRMVPMIDEPPRLGKRKVSDQSPSLAQIGRSYSVQVYRDSMPALASFVHKSKLHLCNPPSKAPLVADSDLTKTGVYFNNREIHYDMHPVQVRYSNRYSTAVPQLPLGKPMPQAPTLPNQLTPLDGTIDQAFQEGSIALSHHNQDRVRDDLHHILCEKVDHDDSELLPRHKRQRAEKSTEQESRTTPTDPPPQIPISKEQLSFIEAALALSELSVTSSERSPRSVLQALPPPPFFLSSHNWDLKDTVKQATV